MSEEEGRVFEAECWNGECPQKVFIMRRKVAEPDEEPVTWVAVECPYCLTTNMVSMPEGVIPRETMLRVKGQPMPEEARSEESQAEEDRL